MNTLSVNLTHDASLTLMRDGDIILHQVEERIAHKKFAQDLYYSFDNKPYWFKLFWKVSDFGRKIICKLPFFLKLIISKLITIFVYVPLAKGSLILEKIGFNVSNIPSIESSVMVIKKQDAICC